MSQENHLDCEQKMHIEKKNKKRVSEDPFKMSKREWEEVMGTNRDRYIRNRGAIRRK